MILLLNIFSAGNFSINFICIKLMQLLINNHTQRDTHRIQQSSIYWQTDVRHRGHIGGRFLTSVSCWFTLISPVFVEKCWHHQRLNSYTIHNAVWCEVFACCLNRALCAAPCCVIISSAVSTLRKVKCFVCEYLLLTSCKGAINVMLPWWIPPKSENPIKPFPEGYILHRRAWRTNRNPGYRIP